MGTRSDIAHLKARSTTYIEARASCGVTLFIPSTPSETSIPHSELDIPVLKGVEGS